MKKSSEKFWRLFEIITTKNCRNQKEICKKVFNKIDNLRTMKKTISRYDNDGKIINETIYDDNVADLASIILFNLSDSSEVSNTDSIFNDSSDTASIDPSFYIDSSDASSITDSSVFIDCSI